MYYYSNYYYYIAGDATYVNQNQLMNGSCELVAAVSDGMI